jgi:hypothetical protein
MDNDKAAEQPRRKFLRQVGMGGIATAALLGLTDIAGLPAARAATRGSRPATAKKVRSVGTRTAAAADSHCGTILATYDGGQCTSIAGAACPHGNCCYYFSANDGSAYRTTFHMCFPTTAGQRAADCISAFTDQWCWESPINAAPVCSSMILSCAKGKCDGACPTGSWCYNYVGCNAAGYMCMPGTCTTYAKPCCV